MNFAAGFLLGVMVTVGGCVYLRDNHYFEPDDYWNASRGPNGEEPVYCAPHLCSEK